jgi:hypothetical protein
VSRDVLKPFLKEVVTTRRYGAVKGEWCERIADEPRHHGGEKARGRPSCGKSTGNAPTIVRTCMGVNLQMIFEGILEF